MLNSGRKGVAILHFCDHVRIKNSFLFSLKKWEVKLFIPNKEFKKQTLVRKSHFWVRFFSLFILSGRCSLAKHGDAYFSAVYGFTKDPIAAPGPYENQEF